jgi:hypothetical protein
MLQQELDVFLALLLPGTIVCINSGKIASIFFNIPTMILLELFPEVDRS